MAKMKFEQLHINLCGGGPQRAAERRWVGIQLSRLIKEPRCCCAGDHRGFRRRARRWGVRSAAAFI
jgi:hypothetical protein